VRGELKDAKAALAAAQQASMTDAEKAIATARAEGKAEAAKEAAERLAAAEFRIAAAGRLANPEAALAVIDLAKLVQKNGEPNRQAIAALVEQLAPQQAQQAGGGHVIPAGPRSVPAQAAGNGDWLRSVQRGPRGHR
jgi:ribosomal protein L17